MFRRRPAEKNASELELKTERVIVFKDGYTLIIKRGVATTDKAGEVFTDDVPDAAVLGSFWAVPEEGRLIAMLAGWKATKDSDEQAYALHPADRDPDGLQGAAGEGGVAGQDPLLRRDPGSARGKDRRAGGAGPVGATRSLTPLGDHKAEGVVGVEPSEPAGGRSPAQRAHAHGDQRLEFRAANRGGRRPAPDQPGAVDLGEGHEDDDRQDPHHVQEDEAVELQIQLPLFQPRADSSS